MSDLSVLMRFQGLILGARALTCLLLRCWAWSL